MCGGGSRLDRSAAKHGPNPGNASSSSAHRDSQPVIRGALLLQQSLSVSELVGHRAPIRQLLQAASRGGLQGCKASGSLIAERVVRAHLHLLGARHAELLPGEPAHSTCPLMQWPRPPQCSTAMQNQVAAAPGKPRCRLGTRVAAGCRRPSACRQQGGGSQLNLHHSSGGGSRSQLVRHLYAVKAALKHTSLNKQAWSHVCPQLPHPN